MPDDTPRKAVSIELYLPDSIIKPGETIIQLNGNRENEYEIKNNKAFEEALYQGGVISYKDDV